jgi:hypothetical protein
VTEQLAMSPAQAVIAWLGLPLLALLGAAAHEAGHVLLGRVAGFRTLLFVVGPLRVERTPGGVALGLNRSLRLAGGLAALAPNGIGDLRRRTLVMVSGGPLASLMLGVQGLALYHATSSGLLRADAAYLAQLTALGLLGFGTISLFIGLISLVPNTAGGFYFDGARMLSLMRADANSEGEVALLALTALSMAGTRPREWDRRLVERAAALRDDGPLEVRGRFVAYAHELDTGDADAARTHLEAALARLERLPRAAQAPLRLAATTFYALFDADTDRARAHFDRAGRGLFAEPHQRRLAEAALLLAQGHNTAAQEAARHATRLAARAVDRGAAIMDSELAAAIEGGAPVGRAAEGGAGGADR